VAEEHESDNFVELSYTRMPVALRADGALPLSAPLHRCGFRAFGDIPIEVTRATFFRDSHVYRPRRQDRWQETMLPKASLPMGVAGGVGEIGGSMAVTAIAPAASDLTLPIGFLIVSEKLTIEPSPPAPDTGRIRVDIRRPNVRLPGVDLLLRDYLLLRLGAPANPGVHDLFDKIASIDLEIYLGRVEELLQQVSDASSAVSELRSDFEQVRAELRRQGGLRRKVLQGVLVAAISGLAMRIADPALSHMADLVSQLVSDGYVLVERLFGMPL
jgi:hypothetical protein